MYMNNSYMYQPVYDKSHNAIFHQTITQFDMNVNPVW